MYSCVQLLSHSLYLCQQVIEFKTERGTIDIAKPALDWQIQLLLYVVMYWLVLVNVICFILHTSSATASWISEYVLKLLDNVWTL